MVYLLWTVLVISSKILPNFCVRTKIECGYKQCPLTRDGALNVHLIPHSHMDAGWVKTFDEYYYGTRATISTANVQLIYHSVLSELLHDKRRKFTFSETAYFWRWWKEQRPNTRATFRSLVQEGRVEFAGGGWTHGDSATVGYLHSLDMWTWGLRKLNDTLGPCGKPKAAWQIDTYGHTREQASLLAQMGFDGLFLGRVDHKERIAMMEEDRMEFMWRGSDVLGKMSDIMTHTLYNLYNPPEGFCFDFLCNDEPLVDDPDTKLYNADKRVNDFISQIERQAKYYDHDNILVTMGGDFTYQSAANWFMNIDKLINHVNTHPANMSDINIFYSTPSCYLKALYLYGRRDKAIYTERGDQLPYGSDETTYWTGFYTSRPAFKYLVRKVHVFLQIVKQLTVIVQSGDSYELHLLRHAVGLVIHHDAITGTSQQHVTNDFIRILSEAVDICSKKASHLLTYLTPTWGANRRSKNSQTFILCHQLNITQCRFIETQETTLLLVYNPLSVKTYHFVRLPALALHYSIRDYNDEEVEYQLLPLPAAAIDLPGRVSNAIQEIYFEAENIPAMGYSAYYISPIQEQIEDKSYSKKTKEKEDMEAELIPQISNEYLKVSIDKNGLLDSISHVDGVKIQLSQNFYYYTQSQRPLQSGAYCFRPEDRPIPVTTEKVPHNTIRGALIREIRQRFSDWVTQIIRLYRGEEFVELEWIVGPVPTGTDLGKEVVSIFTTNISNNGEFYTDSNGRQMMKRSCWNETTGQPIKKPVPACYYPVTTRICIKGHNASVEMCVLPDRTQGGTSYNEGEIELMIHRRLLTDDGFGLDENLNEEAYGIGLVVKGRHRIYFGNYRQEVEDMSFSERVSQAARRWEYEPWLFFASGDKINRRKWQNVRNKRYSALKLHGLPRHVHILTLEPWKANSVLLRLENTLERTNRVGQTWWGQWHNKPTGRFKVDNDAPEDPKSHITVELRKIFLQLKIKQVRETTLAANQWLDDARQMDWSTRYVYSGGEDGILAEDKEVEEEAAIPSVPNVGNNARDPKKEDPDNNSYEEREYRRARKQQKRNRNMKRTEEFIRRKRATNESTTPTTLDLNDITLNITINDSIPLNQTIETTTIKMKKRVKLQRQTQKSSFINKPSHKVPNWEFDEEVRSSEEDFSSNLKKRTPRKKKSKLIKEKEEFFIDDSDDGVTKSIYEMYYKTPTTSHKTRAKTKKINNERGRDIKRKRYSGEVNMNPYSGKRTRGDSEYNREFKAPLKVVRRRGVRRDYDDYIDMDDDDEDDDYDRIDEKKRRSRYKRLAHEEPPEQQSSEPEITEPDYIITLRPTQIRTFIVWFENSKRQYTT